MRIFAPQSSGCANRDNEHAVTPNKIIVLKFYNIAMYVSEIIEFSKAERRIAKEIIKVGILRRHQEWQDEIAALINSPYPDDINAFDRSMEITKSARDFFKEAMRMEEFYRNSEVEFALVILLRDGYLKKDDLSALPQHTADILLAKAGLLGE